MGPLFPTD